MAEHADLVVVGGGPGGYAAALTAGVAGLRVVLVERGRLGGTCLNVGCIPAKELLETAAVHRTVRGASAFGIEVGEPTVDWPVSVARKDRIVEGLVKGLGGLLKARKVTVLDGVGSLGADRTVTVAGGASGDVVVEAGAVIIATGSAPRTIPGFEVDGELVVGSDEFLSLPSLPRTAAVIGGGAIGCEFASTLADLGVAVTVLEAMPGILAGVDADAVKLVERSFRRRGITVRSGVQVHGHTPGADGGTTVAFGEGETVEVELVVTAVGRRPVTDGLGLVGTAVSLDERGHVAVDDRCRTGEDRVWAVGDVIATPALAHVAFAEGMLAVADLLGEEPTPIDHSRVPWCIYCHPEVAFVGHSEQSARAAGLEVVVSSHRWLGNGRAQILGETEGLVKVIALDEGGGVAGQVVGVHMVGPWVTEQLGQAYLAVNWEATAPEIARLIQPHPTLSELFGETVMALTGRPLHG